MGDHSTGSADQKCCLPIATPGSKYGCCGTFSAASDDDCWDTLVTDPLPGKLPSNGRDGESSFVIRGIPCACGGNDGASGGTGVCGPTSSGLLVCMPLPTLLLSGM